MAKRKRETKSVSISQDLLNSYRTQVDKQGDRAAQFMESAIGTYMKQKPDATVAQVREFTYELMQSALPNFTDLSETLSCEFMEMLASKHGWDDIHPELFDSTDYELVDRKLHYLAGYLADGDVEKFKSDVADVTKYYVKRAAQENMIKNCDKAEVRYARVPTGFETCSFCFMLASRGFEYRDEITAGSLHKFHTNCDCIVVPGAKGRTKIDGYDPEGMYKRWESCEKAIGGSKQAKVEWEALDEVDKVGYIERADGDKSKAFRDFQRNRIQREIETRDWHWLYTGEAPKIDYSLQSRDSIGQFTKPGSYECEDIILVKSKKGKLVEPNEWRDLFVHDSLSANGFRVKLRPDVAIGKDGKPLKKVTCPDIEIDGVIWEIKSPRSEGSSYKGNYDKEKATQFIEDAFRSSIKNFSNPYDYNKKTGMGDKRYSRRVVLNLRYRDDGVPYEDIESRIKYESEKLRIKEVLVVDRNGAVRRYKNS